MKNITTISCQWHKGMVLLILALPVLILSVSPATAQVDAVDRVTISEWPAMPVVYLDYTGPYWTVGKELARVRDEMVRAGAPGPLFARYLDDKVNDSPASRRIQLGFGVTPDSPAPTGFHYTVWPATTCAVLSLPRPPTSLPRSAATVHRLARVQDYVGTQAMVEVYLQSDKDWTVSPVELRLPVQKIPPPPAPPPAPSPHPARAPTDEAPGLVQNEPKNVVTRRIDLRPRGGTPANIKEESTPAPPPVPVSRAVMADQQPPPPESRPGPVSSVTFGPKVARQLPRTADPAAEIKVPRSPVTPDRQSVRELVADGRFNEIALRLMPMSAELSPALRQWIGELVGRADAASRGMSDIYPTDAFTITAVADALNRHYEIWATSEDKATRQQPATPIGINRDVPEPARRLIRDMDILLARMAQRALSSDELQSQFEGLLQQSVELVESTAESNP